MTKNQVHKQKGVTLVELVIVMIVMGVVAVPLMSGFVTSARSLLINDEVETATMLVQECAETILAKRRGVAGYDSSGTGFSIWCATGPIPGYASYNRTVNVDTVTYPPGTAPCSANAAECASVEISVGVGGQARANINMLLVN